MSRSAERATSLVDLCAPLFAFVVELQAGPAESKTAEPPRYDVMSARARELLAGLDAAGRDHGFGKETVDQAKYALVAMIDEVVLASRWNMREEWLRRPLAAELFSEFNAGEEFFRRIEQLGRGSRPDPHTIGVMEVYATCLSLGFRGMHIDTSGQERLREILFTLSRRIVESRDAMPLAPHWEQKESVARSVGRLPTAVLLAGGFAVIALLWGVFELLMYWEASSLGSTLKNAPR
jgi:type VI secretion system protein ImpK